MTNKKTKPLLWVGLILLAIVLLGGTGLFASIDGSTVGKDCNYAKNQMTYGAGQDQCYAQGDRLAYVEIMEEGTTSCGGISPACPDGVKPTCKIESCESCWEKIFTCDIAYSSYGGTVQVCKYDTDCQSHNCEMGICQGGLPSDCTVTGDKRCYSASQYQNCLSSGSWSGILSCGSGTICYQGDCLTADEIANIQNQESDAGDTTTTGLSFDKVLFNLGSFEVTTGMLAILAGILIALGVFI